jgi:hypothetical protein
MFLSKICKILGVVPFSLGIRKVAIRLLGKKNSNSHGARPVHQIITMLKWIWTSKLSIKNSLSRKHTVPFRGHAVTDGQLLLFFFITLGLELSDTKVYEP